MFRSLKAADSEYGRISADAIAPDQGCEITAIHSPPPLASAGVAARISTIQLPGLIEWMFALPAATCAVLFLTSFGPVS